MTTVTGYNYDIFLSYSRKRAKWVRSFCDALISELEDEVDGDTKIFYDFDHIETGSKWNEAINDALKDTFAFLAVVSPSYFKLESVCGKEHHLFLQHNGGMDGIKIGDKYRFVKVVIRPPKTDLLADFQHVEFFDRGNPTKTFKPGSEKFQKAISKTAKAIALLFEAMNNKKVSVYLASQPPKLVNADEAPPAWKRVSETLSDRHFNIIPQQWLSPYVDQRQFIQNQMEPCSRAFFLLDNHPDGLMKTQIQTAIALKKPSIFWIPGYLDKQTAAERERLVDELYGGHFDPQLRETVSFITPQELCDYLRSLLKEVARSESFSQLGLARGSNA